ncbi:acyl-CoA dehydrogenase [Parashewanella curva]|uniref:Acyl-coenzyme A dehydrogenase n=1 Tax=Parashewanella curva TaxID=2338552 RepID=A0A3L8PT88_9GAMM|nr:acyl-CoA dehydrogenase FadE [Parashewanella curva]RLV58647.1 acyl-CoA dehydrogenase [Parashewanella curva]
MLTLTWIVGLIVLIGACSYLRVSLMMTTLLTGLFICAMSYFNFNHPALVILFLVISIPLNVSAIRRQLFSKPMLALYKKIMPEMSSTEKEALEAGTTWWEADLFSGAPNWKKLHNYSSVRLTPEEQAFLDGPVEEVCGLVNQHMVSHELADLPENVWQYLKDNGFFSMIIKKKYGGMEFSAYAQTRVLQKLAGVSSELASTVGVPNSLGPGELLQHYGTETQKDHYLPRLAKGLEIPCFALTSPEAGSDAGSIPDYGVVCKGFWQGKEVLGMKLTWNKRYITLAPIATVLGLAFKLRDPEQLLGDKEELGITCALIPTDTQGVIIGRRHFPLNCMFQNGPTQGNEVFVPLDFIIGGKEMAGQGWRMLVECLSVGRGITLPSNAAGGVKTAAIATGAYARIRRQFKLPIGKLEGIEEPMARIGGNAYLMEAVTSLTTTGIDLGEKPSVISAIVKYHLTDRMQKCVVDAMDIHGGKGICLGPNNYLGRGYQAAPIAVTVEGANILTRSMIIYGQGAIRCHPYVLAEMQSAFNDNPAKALKEFDSAVFGHIGFAMSNFFRSLWLGITGARLSNSPYKDKTKRYYQHMNRFSANLALLSDIAMATLGGELKRKERISARLGDLLSQLYLTSATLKRYNDDGRLTDDLPLAQWAIEDSLHKLQISLDELLDNFPKGLGKLLRLVIFPFGRCIKRPSDQLDHKVARIMQTPSATRERLGTYQYFQANDNNPIGMQEQALSLILKAEPLHKKVCDAVGRKLPFMQLDKVAELGIEHEVLNEDEVKLLRQAEKGRLRSINVDDFEPAELKAQAIETKSKDNYAA